MAVKTKTEKTAIFIVVSFLIILFTGLLYLNIGYLVTHLFGEKKSFEINKVSYAKRKRSHLYKHKKKASYYVEFNGFSKQILTEVAKPQKGEQVYKERIGETVQLYYHSFFGLSVGHNDGLKMQFGIFFFLLLLDFAFIKAMQFEFFPKK
ncbi:hypothetical protein [Tenacibaculum jejuense]|uniref:DUF3592 domain-containing protein n=1 Tax=Tenacibaculum jejuense TaxID=584609 RepID=A0A238UB48_9FLAO|nr:hypothetical protein [Tenacibaculum jejuense]SNR16427.1 Probable transmembrane protein of unknown function [Tenacibaculum jejuense]